MITLSFYQCGAVTADSFTTCSIVRLDGCMFSL